ncbi:MAG: TerB family tellurite resistance protein [Bacteroidales bacterium]|jgi:DnaJ like chaperone protein|nr:TerB family tellurite resistance protein [Bacteroidales bacterium]
MGNFVKWIGGGLGWTFGGPLGGVLGFVAGTVYDSLEIHIFRKSDGKKTMGDFATGLLVLIAAIMKAEGPVVKSELDYVKHFLKQNFGEKEASEALTLLREILKQKISIDSVCAQIRNNVDYSSRLQLTHFLYNLANVDGHMTGAEQNILNIITKGLRVTVSDKRSIGSVIVQEESLIAAYGIIGVHRSASVIDIKKAYRNMAIKCHPDKVAYLGEELRKAANNKFQQLTHAYEIIKKERNFT